MEAEEDPQEHPLCGIVRGVQHVFLWGFILQLHYSVFIEPQQKQRHQDAFTLYGECETGSKASSSRWRSSLLAYPELPVEFLSPVKAPSAPERLIKADALTMHLPNPLFHFLFVLSNCCFR